MTFPKVCGGVTSIAAPGAAVTYSGRVKQSSDPVSLVKVTAFTPALVLDTTTKTPGTHLSVAGFTEVNSCGAAALTVIYATDLNGTMIPTGGHDDQDGD